jgi:hypothetical protein
MAADGAAGDAELVGGARETAMAGGGLEGAERVERWKFHDSLASLVSLQSQFF